MAPTPSPEQPADAAVRRLRRRLVLLLFVALLIAAGWRYRVTRTEYRFARGEEAVRAGDAEAVRAYADRLEATGAPDHAHFLRGSALLHFGAPARALDQLNQVRADGPLRVRAVALSGRCLLALGAFREAHAAFSFVVGEEPDNADAHRGLGAIAYDLGQLGEAISHLSRVAELDPADARPHRLIGLIHKDMTRNEAAEAAYREALRRNPPPDVERDVRVELAEVLVRQGRFADGIEALAGTDDHPPAAAVRAECLRGLGRAPEAAGALDAALKKHPTGALWRTRGQIRQDLGQPAEALRCFEQAVELDPSDYQSLYLLAQAYSAAGRGADAARANARAEQLRADLDRLTTLTREAMANPWDPTVQLNLAELCDRLGKTKLADVWRKAAAACSKSTDPR